MIIPCLLYKGLKKIVDGHPEEKENWARHWLPIVVPILVAFILTLCAIKQAQVCHTGPASWLSLAFALVSPEVYLVQHYIHTLALGDLICNKNDKNKDLAMLMQMPMKQ